MACQAQKNVQRSDFGVRLQRAAIAVALTLPAVAAQAQQVYKWVDADGRVQYSERKPTEPAAAARTTEIKPPPPPQPPPPPVPRPLRPMPPPLPTTPANMDRPHAVFPQPANGGNDPPPALSRGLNRETDAYKCALARDILNGSVRRVFGGPMDENDRQIARGDIRLFCK